VKEGLTEIPPPTPRAALDGADAASVATRGRAMIRENGTFAFLGRYPLSVDPPAALRSRTLQAEQAIRRWAVVEARAYLARSTGGIADPDDLVLVDAQLVDDSIVVQFDQYVASMRIEGVSALVAVGQSGVFYARHNLVLAPKISSSHQVTSHRAQQAALAHMLASVRAASPRGEPEKVVLLDEDQRAQLAWRVEIDANTPNGWWAIYVHAGDGSVTARKKLSFHAVAGSVHFEVEPNCQGDPTELVKMPYVEWNGDEHTDAGGGFSTVFTPPNAKVVLDGPYFTLHDRKHWIGGPWTFSLQPHPARNDLEVTDAHLDQTGAFYHAHVARQWMLRNGGSNVSQVRFAATDLDININVHGECNAYYDGLSLNFFDEGGGCNDTARLPVIVFHEYGHAIHDHSGRYMDGQVSEGIADFVSATIRNDPDIGGIFSCRRSFRSCDNALSFCRRGCDFDSWSDIHQTGQVICAALWEFRQMMVSRYGYDTGVAHTDRIFLRFLTLVGDMHSTYDAAIAADDDDDNNPANGTTHSCELNRAFADDSPGGTNHFPRLRGVVPSLASAKLTHDPPGRIDSSADTGLSLDFAFTLDPTCLTSGTSPQVKATLVFALPGQTEREVELRASGGSDIYTARIPDLEPPVTLSYYARFEVGGQEFYYPAQPDDPDPRDESGWPVYRQGAYFGDQQAIFSDDLEVESSAFATTTRNDNGIDDGLSDWQHGKPSASAAGPSGAHSGRRVWGTNLGGPYSEDRVSTLELGPLSTQGYSQVRLQLWRQLFSAGEVRIEVNGEIAYQQRATHFDWKDPEWVFLDIDISTQADDKDDVRIRFVLDDIVDNNKELAGLYIDDLQLVGTPAPGLDPRDPTSQDLPADDGSQAHDGSQAENGALPDNGSPADNDAQGPRGSNADNRSRDVAPLVSAVGCTSTGSPSASVWLVGLAALYRRRWRR
jgi:hypothetical protein